MSTASAKAAESAAAEIVAALESAWNRADGVEFARYFAEDADFVNIYGMHGKGREAIGAAHDMIFRTVYRGSRMSMTITQLRTLREGVALMHLHSRLEVPEGPLQGEMHGAPSAVLTLKDGRWVIAAFHNTLVQTPPAMHNNGQPG
jgi:uncharacterized protein (TIGR02246 family)